MDQKAIARFWTAVDKNGPIHNSLGTRCWVWIRGKDFSGYGMFKYLRKRYRSHRVSWFLSFGNIPLSGIKNGLGVCILHKCDNPSCVNPDHLFMGNSSDNAKDLWNKNRQSSKMVQGKVGESNGRSKLTESQVLEARRRYNPGCKINGRTALAREYGVSPATMRDALLGINWKHLN